MIMQASEIQNITPIPPPPSISVISVIRKEWVNTVC